MFAAQRLPSSLTPLDVAREALLRELKAVAANELPPLDTLRCEADEMPELYSWPPHDSAAVDGWALRASDLVGASSYTPLSLPRQPTWVEAGDRIPDGCDCVLDEDTIDAAGPTAQAFAEGIPGQGVRRKGGAVDVGRIADAWRIGDIAARRPRVRVVNIPGGNITAKLIAGRLREAGIEVVSVEAAARDAASIGRQLDAYHCNLLIVVGGSGVGRTDASVKALAGRGEVLAHGLALQPGRTAAVGRIGQTLVIVIPGAPDQALSAWWTLALPALDRLTGRQRGTVTLPLARKIASSVGIAEVALLERAADSWIPLATGDLQLETVARADAWLLVPGSSEGYAAGAPANAYLLRK